MGDRSRARGARVYVGGLSESVKKEDLEQEFEKYGKLNSVWVAMNPPGFGFIEFNSTTDAESACDNLNGTDFFGSQLKVEMARERREGFRGGGRGGGGFRGGRGGRGGGRDFDGGYNGGSGGGDRYGSRDFGRRNDSFRGGYRGRGGGGGGGDRFRSRSPGQRY